MATARLLLASFRPGKVIFAAGPAPNGLPIDPNEIQAQCAGITELEDPINGVSGFFACPDEEKPLRNSARCGVLTGFLDMTPLQAGLDMVRRAVVLRENCRKNLHLLAALARRNYITI